MKKFLPYILILVIIANIFAPFTVQVNKNNIPKIQTSKVLADAGIMIRPPEYLTSDTYVRIRYKIEFTENGFMTNEKLIVVISDPAETDINKKIVKQVLVPNLTVTGTVTASNGTQTQLVEDTVKIAGLSPDKDYDVYATIVQSDYGDLLSKVPVVALYNYIWGDKKDIWGSDVTKLQSNTDRIHTNPAGQTNENSVRGQATANEEAFLPQCSLMDGSQGFLGCFAQLFYYGLFVPTAFLFGLAGKFFDWTFAYSIIDTSYRSSFVVEGWGIVRDICNIFFIFILIYAAFGMILSIHSIKAKEILINTIIIGLLINFSLFAGQVLIDASNILARVFYNSEAISISVNGNGQAYKGGIATTQNSEIGELSISAALVGKINPQRIVIESSNVNVKDDVTGKSGTATDTTQKMGAGSFFLIVILAIAVNVTGMFVFLSVGLIFISRVIGLWFSLIFAPFAFFSYTVPQLQNVPMLGWKKWWPEILGLCFLAPIFMFFMYLILLFLNTGFAGIMAEQSGPNWVLSVIIPFIFIIMLLLTAKKLAQKYSGDMGQMITGAVTAVGAVALGGAALGAAFVGRTAIGRPLKAVSNSRSALHMDEHREKMKSYSTKYEEWKKNGSIGPAPVKPIAPQHGDVIGKNKNGKDIKYNALVGAWGSQMNSRETDQGHIIHTRHELDEISKKEFNGQTYGELGAGQKQKAKDLLTDEKAKKKYDKIARDEYGMDYKDSSMGINEKKRVRDLAKMMAKNDVEHSADSKISAGSTFQTSMRKGSYDVRNLSALGTNNMDSIFNKLGTKLMIGIGMGMRMGFKSSGINHGTGQKDFFKDISTTITEALKNVKIEVPKGGGGGHDDHGGGGHDDHGGGGGGHH